MPRTFLAPAHPSTISTRQKGVKVDRIVLHDIEGTFLGAIAWFQGENGVSSHYVVSRQGDICQMVDDDKKANHAGGYNSRSIGVEMEARLDPWPARLHRDGSVKPPPFPVNEWPEAMLLSAAKVVAIMCRKFGIPLDREHVVGHYEVPGASHRDPGTGFPWDTLMEMAHGA